MKSRNDAVESKEKHEKDEDAAQSDAGRMSVPDLLENARRPERIRIRVPVRHNDRLQRVIERVNADSELYALWQVVNVNAVKRLGMSDHGPVHVQIVTNIALKLLRLLGAGGVQPNIVTDYDLTHPGRRSGRRARLPAS